MAYATVKNIEDARKLLQELSLEEESLKKEISDVLVSCQDADEKMRKTKMTIPNPNVLRSDAEELKKELTFTCSIAERTASKIKKMDLISKRVEDCLTRVGDIADLKTCTEKIQDALDNEEYENAALIVQRFLRIDEQEVKKSKSVIESSNQGMSSLEEAFSKLHGSREKLQQMVMSKFDESVKKDDVAMVERFFKLFPFLNQEKEGLRKFSNYLSTKVHDDVTRFMSSSSSNDSSSTSPNGNGQPSHPEQLGNLFQVIAKIIDVHQPLVETYYKHGNLLFVMEILQKECDRRSRKILDDFKTKRKFKSTVKLIHKSLKNVSVNNSWATTTTVAIKVDPRDLDTLLTEMIFITCRSETYLKFLRKRATDDFNVAYPDATNPERIDAMNRLENFIRSCDLSSEIQVLSGHYVMMEEYFLRESIIKAIEMDEETEVTNADSVTSNLLDDVFFILKKCVRRATSSGNMDVLCAVINHSIAVLETTYADALNERIKYGYPNTLASAAANLDLSQAYNALQSGRYLQSSSDLEKTKKLFLTGVNNLDLTSESILTLKANVRDEVSRSTVLSYGQSDPKQSGKLESCLLDLSALTSKFQNLRHSGLHQMYLSLLKPRIKLWVEGFLDADHELSEEDIHGLETSTEAGLRTFTSSFLFDVDQVLKPLQSRLTTNNFEVLISIFSGESASRIETAILKCSYNRLGAHQVDREIRAIINYMTSCSSHPIRDKFSRLKQVVSILNVESLSEVTDYAGSGLSSTDIRSVLKMRTDFERSDIRRLKL